METVTTVLLWLLGVVFLMAGGMKALMPQKMMAENEQMAWVEREGIGRARLAGWTELAAFTVHRPNDEPMLPTLVLAVLALVLAVGLFTT